MLTYWLLGENKQKRLTRLESLYSETGNLFCNISNLTSEVENSGDDGLSIIETADKNVASSSDSGIHDVNSRTQRPSVVSVDNELLDLDRLVDGEYMFVDGMDPSGPEEHGVVCNGNYSKDIPSQRRRKQGDVEAGFELTPLLECPKTET